MLFFTLLILLCPSLILTQDFYTVKFAPSTLTSVPYLNGEITVYEHVNQSRYYLPPLAILQINDTQVLFNRFTNRYYVRLALVLFTKQLHETVLDYLRKNLDLCKSKTECQIKMIPIDRLRIVWKRLHALSEDYELDSSWISNTILLSAIYFNIGCTTYSACDALQRDISRKPQIIDGLELEYSTPTEKHMRREITIMGSHVMNTNMFASLQQMPKTTESNTRYLLADDMNTLISEVIANVEMSDTTDAGYVSYDDQVLVRDLLKNRIAINQDILLGHKARQWESVYWNSDNIRPDLTVKLLNEQISKRNNEISNETQNDIESKTHLLNETENAGAHSSFNDTSKQFAFRNDTSGGKYAHQDVAKTTFTDNYISDTRDASSASASASSNQQESSSSAHSSGSVHHSRGGSSGFFDIGARGGSSSTNSFGNSNSQSSYNAQSNYNRESNREFTDNKRHDIDYQSGSKKDINANYYGNSLGESGALANIRAQNLQSAEYKKLDDMDNFAVKNLDKDSFKKYEENREYLEFHGNHFEVKPVTVYRINLGQFHETLKLVSKSVVIQRINSIHAIPIRAMGDPVVLTPIIEEYKANMDEKLVEMKNALLNSIHQTFLEYKAESRAVLDQTILSTTQIISKTLTSDGQQNETDTELRSLIKKALAKTMKLQDIGLFDNGILDYYRHHANPTEKITIVSLQPLKVGLHFRNAYIEGMVCDDEFKKDDAQIICRLYSNSTSQSSSVRAITSIYYDQKSPTCRFQTTYVNEWVPCPFLMSSLDCPRTNKSLLDCKFQRPLKSVTRSCQSDEHINVFC